MGKQMYGRAKRRMLRRFQVTENDDDDVLTSQAPSPVVRVPAQNIVSAINFLQ